MILATLEQADAWIAEQRAARRSIGFVCGAFDLLHAGHVQYLERARALCDCLIAAVNSDDSIRRYKNPLRPINPESHRIYVLSQLKSVDAVVLMPDDRPLSLLQRWQPDFYLKGGDYHASSLRSADFVRSYGGRVEVIPSDFSTSTTQLIDHIAAIAAHAIPHRVPPQPPARGLVILDRDGTLIRDIPFLRDPAQVELLPGVIEGLKTLRDAGFLLAIASNQQGIGLGYLTTQDFIAVNQRLFREFAPHGILISKIYFCPHTAPDRCDCRKPAAGMLARAMQDFAMSPQNTFFIGDLDSDLEAGEAAGCQTYKLDSSRRFTDAVDWILSA